MSLKETILFLLERRGPDVSGPKLYAELCTRLGREFPYLKLTEVLWELEDERRVSVTRKPGRGPRYTLKEAAKEG